MNRLNTSLHLSRQVSLAAIVFVAAQSSFFGQKPVPSNNSARSHAVESYGKLPLSFEANRGQADPAVRFVAHGADSSLFLTDAGAVFAFSGLEPSSSPSRTDLRQPLLRQNVRSAASQDSAREGKASVLRMQLEGARAADAVSGEDALPGTANYFVGNRPEDWQARIPTYSRVRYAGVYPGVDVVYYGNRQQLEYDFVVAPHADASQIKLRFDGAKDISIDAKGDLAIQMDGRSIRFHKPTVYQRIDGHEHSIEGAFELPSVDTVSFHLGDYDHAAPLIIDPVLAYSTYVSLGGVQALAVDTAGEVVITGWTGSAFPTTPGAVLRHDPISGMGDAIFVAKLNAEGSALVYATYLGGAVVSDFLTYSTGVAVDKDGDAYVVGETNQADFPTTKGSFRPTPKNVHDGTGFVTKINPTGTVLLFSTYFGGTVTNSPIPNWIDIPQGVAVDGAGHAYVVDMTTARDFPVTAHAYQPKINPANIRTECAVAKLRVDGSAIVWGTYLGGNWADQCSAIAVDKEGDVSVGGYTESADYPVTSNAFVKKLPGVPGSGMVSTLNSVGTGLLYSTFLGGNSGADGVVAIAVDPRENVYAMGLTDSTNFPTTPGAFMPRVKDMGIDSFVTKFSLETRSVIYSTYLGGPGLTTGTGLAVDPDGDAYVTGDTMWGNFPATKGAFLTVPYSIFYGSEAPFLTKLNAKGTALLYSTFLGGSGRLSEHVCGCAKAVTLDQNGNVYAAGGTYSEDLPTTPGSLMPDLEFDRGLPPWDYPGHAPYVMKFNAADMKAPPPTAVSIVAKPNPQKIGSPVTFTVHVKNQASGGPPPTGQVGFDIWGYIWDVQQLDATGSAKFTAPTDQIVPGGWYGVAMYLGDDAHAPSNAYVGVLIE